ncbi:MAG: hypothetical protein BGO21_17270 [Dyadobacter sp. 50-39]|uniref:hypothetical protein n=1 Tax=Dyadobacter sp. 50-39 TaxID=1895756 RepID=UPI000963FECA|nr:hypothetical protein [Dyadobacter sp. 50-39]OJV14473.1 MAG: hypothetical protein BGO21_17270 [Dyadobacter sp. 50-39]
MLRLLFPAVILLTGLLMFQCKPTRSVLTISELPNYNSQFQDHILFLHFRITGNPGGGKEKVELVSATVGNGRMKDIRRPVTFPVYINVVPRYAGDSLRREMQVEHPLRRSIEVSDAEGQIRRQEVRQKEGTFVIRMPVEAGLNGLELFSVSPERGGVQIYNLRFK